MSSIRSCDTCGKRISLRQMPHGRYVAFDANTNKIHKHSKKKRSKSNGQSTRKDHPQTLPAHSPDLTSDQSSDWGPWIFGAIVLGIIVFIFS